MTRIPSALILFLTFLLLLSCGKKSQIIPAEKEKNPRLEFMLEQSAQVIGRKEQLNDSLLISLMSWKDKAGNWTIADRTEPHSPKQKLKFVLKNERFYITAVQQHRHTEIVYIDRKSGYFMLRFQTTRNISTKKQLVNYVLGNSMICDQLKAAQTVQEDLPGKVDRAYFLRTNLVTNTFEILYIDESKDRIDAAMADVLRQLGKDSYGGLEQKLGETITGEEGFLHLGKVEPELTYDTEIEGSGWLDDDNIEVSATVATYDFICLDVNLELSNSTTFGSPATFKTYKNRHRQLHNTRLLMGRLVPPDYFFVFYIRFGVEVSGKLSNGKSASKIVYIAGKLATLMDMPAVMYMDTDEKMPTSTYYKIVR